MISLQHLDSAVPQVFSVIGGNKRPYFLFELGFLSLATKKDLINANTFKYI